MKMQNISDHCTYKEATKSITARRHGLQNDPGANTLISMRILCEKVFEPMRAYFNMPIFISSFYRCPELNKIIGGSDNSQHMKGEAMDMDADVYNGMANSDIFRFIKKNLDFDQLIWEFGDDDEPEWVHVSYCRAGNRKQVFRSFVKNGIIKYIEL